MLFDLRGKRRRAVQVTYVSLALLMAVGLIGAGIGSNVTGGFFDLFNGSGGSSTSDVNKPVKKRIEATEKKLAANPKDTAALALLIRDRYTLAASDTDRQTGEFGKDGKEELGKVSAAWKRYLAAKPEKPDVSLAGLMMTAYSPTALNQAANGAEAAEIVAEDKNDPSAYLQLVQFAALAGQTRKADLAGKRAIELAPKSERSQVKQLVEQAKAAASQSAGGAAGGANTAGGG
jgi:F0F1-type ATP synthase membrane subunit c/vacuolar-type H+-ATPase subunit K